MIIREKVDNWRGQMRIPRPIADWIQGEAQKNFRSMNAELIELLKAAKDRAEKNEAQ